MTLLALCKKTVSLQGQEMGLGGPRLSSSLALCLLATWAFFELLRLTRLPPASLSLSKLCPVPGIPP